MRILILNLTLHAKRSKEVQGFIETVKNSFIMNLLEFIFIFGIQKKFFFLKSKKTFLFIGKIALKF
jgi:hypothetical protein